ncbi:MAG TPA: nuclear transport factor 2 family protein [Vicinamibacterales bacterium]|nr:nuclear transport factor 2 family protein [Vicinamibacterales bacterium]
MKHLVTSIAVVSLVALSGSNIGVSAQAPPDRAAVEKAIMANEMKINDAFMKKDIATLKTLIADDGVGVDMMGASPVAEMYKQLPTMDMKISESSLTGFKYIWIDANTVVVTYTWTGKGTMMGQPVPSPAYGSTVWTKRGNAWRAVFHQETVAMPAPKK